MHGRVFCAEASLGTLIQAPYLHLSGPKYPAFCIPSNGKSKIDSQLVCYSCLDYSLQAGWDDLMDLIRKSWLCAIFMLLFGFPLQPCPGRSVRGGAGDGAACARGPGSHSVSLSCSGNLCPSLRRGPGARRSFWRGSFDRLIAAALLIPARTTSAQAELGSVLLWAWWPWSGLVDARDHHAVMHHHPPRPHPRDGGPTAPGRDSLHFCVSESLLHRPGWWDAPSGCFCSRCCPSPPADIEEMPCPERGLAREDFWVARTP